ncbi:MAG: recombinase family protein [Gemmiger sp.]
MALKAALYCRLSREDDEDGESESIRNQKALLLQYAREQGYTVYGIYCDENYSGIDRERPAFNEMLRAASRREFEVILVKTQSRFTRDMELVERYLHGLFLEWGIRFIAVVDHVDTGDDANKKSRQINGLVNQWYLEDLSANVRSVLTQKRREGRYIAAFALYGYQKDPRDHNHLVIDPAAAAVVRRIFGMAAAGQGAAAIAGALNAEGLPNPTLYKQQRGGPCLRSTDGRWSAATVHQMLRNRTYAGDLVQGRHKKVSYKSKKTVWLPREQWIVVPGTHEAIIDRATFDAVQRLRAARARSSGNGTVHPLAGRVRCALCGRALTTSGREGGYLRCRNCPGRGTGLPTAALEAVLVRRMRVWLAQVENAPPPAPCPDAAQQRLQAELRRLEAERQRRTGAMQRLYLDRQSGLVDEGQCQALLAVWQTESRALEARAGRVRQRLATMQQTGPAEQTARLWTQALRPASLTRELVCLLVDAVTVGPKQPDGRHPLRIEWRF